jgi:hypothetical protein
MYVFRDVVDCEVLEDGDLDVGGIHGESLQCVIEVGDVEQMTKSVRSNACDQLFYRVERLEARGWIVGEHGFSSLVQVFRSYISFPR